LCYIVLILQPNDEVGVKLLESRGFFTESYWYWIGLAALVGFAVILNILFTLALHYLNRNDRLVSLTIKFVVFRILFMCLSSRSSDSIVWVYFSAPGKQQAVVAEDLLEENQEREMQTLRLKRSNSFSPRHPPPQHEIQTPGNIFHEIPTI
jgi:hypothetical protein